MTNKNRFTKSKESRTETTFESISASALVSIPGVSIRRILWFLY